MSGPRIGVIIYSMYGHVAKMAESVKKGIESVGGNATILQVPETLPQEVLTKMYAPPKPDYPVATPADLTNFDGLLFGISTRYGGWPAQFKTFWDATGQLWAQGALAGKFAGAFVSTGGPGGGQESTYFSILTTLVHHGMVFVPLGYKHTNAIWQQSADVVRGGSPFGAGTFASPDGSRQPSELELEVASVQGKEFYNIVKRYVDQSTKKVGSPAPPETDSSIARPSPETQNQQPPTASNTKTDSGTTKSKPEKRKSILGRIVHSLKH